MVCCYGRPFLLASGDCGRRNGSLTIAVTGLEGSVNVLVMRTGRLRAGSWNQMLRRWRAGGFIR
jgi:hypothetical protein